MTFSDASKPQTDNKRIRHLILLVGMNPLPNAVAGKYLSDSKTTISLIYTRGTYSYFESLRNWFHEQGIAHQIKEQIVEEISPDLIYKGVVKCLNSVSANEIILNFTGGTKLVGTTAFRAVVDWLQEKEAHGQDLSAWFTYLDAYSLNMLMENRLPGQAGGIGMVTKEYVGNQVELSLDELLKLHRWTLLKPPCRQPVLPKTASVLANAYVKGAGAEWVKWKMQELFAQCQTPRDRQWKNEADLAAIELRFPEQSALQSVVSALHEELGLPENAPCLRLSSFSQASGLSKIQDVCDWLNGKWLEHFVLSALIQASTTLKIHSCWGQSIEIREVHFEVDVIAVCGYQLFAFSCTTSLNSDDRVELKKRLFEVYVRARQMGGDEAKLALVCCSGDPYGLQDEIQRDFDFDKRVNVFGMPHLADLSTHIAQWIKSQSKEK